MKEELKTISDILKRFNDEFNSMDKLGVIYGKDNSIRLDNNLNQLGAIKDFIASEIKELLEGIEKNMKEKIADNQMWIKSEEIKRQIEEAKK